MTATRVFKNPFPSKDELDLRWSTVFVRESKLNGMLDNKMIVVVLFEWIDANCEDRYYISTWYRLQKGEADGQIEIHFENSQSAFACKMRFA